MSRVTGLIAVLIVLLVGAMLAKRQITHRPSASAEVSASQASAPTAPEVRTAEQARRLTEQVQSDVNRMVEDHSKQVQQNIDSQTP